MRQKYTIEKVTNIFLDRGCVLLEKKYINQYEKLNYIASCGHNNTTILNRYRNGAGTICRNCALKIPTYEEMYDEFKKKECILGITKNEFNIIYKNADTKIKYYAKCKHENLVTYNHFKNDNQGIYCPTCVCKNIGIKLKESRSGDNKNMCMELEYKCIQYFIELVKQYFNVKKLYDGCKSDIVLKPINEKTDMWLGIQVKSTLKFNGSQYLFGLNKKDYENCLILCISYEEKNIWLIPYTDVKGLSKIGIANKSKYNKYEVTIDTIFENLQCFYNSTNKYSYDVLNCPISKTNQLEQEYRNIREKAVDFLDFTPLKI